MGTSTITPQRNDSLYLPVLVMGSEIEELKETYCSGCQRREKCEVMEGLADHVLFESPPPKEIGRTTLYFENNSRLVCKCFSKTL